MLEISPPIPKQTVGKTFVVAISVLGAVALVQIVLLGWAFLKGAHPADKSATAAIATDKLSDPFATAANVHTPHAPEIPKELPKPHPVDLKPRPLPAEAAKAQLDNLSPVSASELRVNELIETARTLRERGDTATTITRLREAQAIQPQNASVMFEMAMTYEKMGYSDKAAENWRKIFQLGDAAGPFFAAAESKLRAAEAMARLAANGQPADAASGTPAPAATPAATPTPASEPEGFQPGALLALTDIALLPQNDPESTQRLVLRIPIRGRPRAKVDVRDVIIHVDFYDAIDGQNIVRTNANVSSHWTTLPIDWADDDVEVLEVEYSQPKLDVKRAAEGRKFYGYIIRVYYKTELQDMRADPVSLLKQYPPPLKLSSEEPK
jgi:tetratricopeptide (TPR) repeat protein